MTGVRVLVASEDDDLGALLEGEECAVERADAVADALERIAGSSGSAGADPSGHTGADRPGSAGADPPGRASIDRPAGADSDPAGSASTDPDEPPIECVVAAAELAEGTGFELAEAVAERDHLLPVVVAGPDPLAAVAEAAVGADVAGYAELGTPDAGDRLRALVADAVERYRERRDRERLGRGGPGARCVLRAGAVSAAAGEFAPLLGAETVEGAALRDLVDADDEEAVAAALADLDAGSAEATVRVAPAAAERTVELRLRRSPVDGAVVASAVDVTERAERVAAIERDVERLDSLLANVPMSIYFKDREGRHERVSHYITRSDPEDYIMNAEGKVHPHHEDVFGKTDFDLYAPGFAEETVADDQRVMEDSEPIVDRLEEGTTSLGAEQFTSTTKAPRYDEAGNVIGLVGVTVDVTDRIQHRHELERQNERLNEFAEVLTHDLRNPLNIAQGYLDVLEEEYDETAVAEAGAALDRIDSLVGEIRSFVLLGRTVEDPEAVDLARVARESWSTVDTGSASLEVEGEVRIEADPDRLRTLLENCYRNAVEHALPEDAPEEELTVRVVALEDGFAVEDDGTGLPADVGGEVFDRGYTTSDDGTGFGLAIVRNVAEAHGWTVGVGESDEGGACLSFTDVVRAERQVGTTIS